MRNLKRALSLTLASVMLLGMMVLGTSAASYPDVDDNDNVEAIEVLQAIGVMSGSNSGNFNPDSKVTRIEMAIVMANLLDLDVDYFQGQNQFSDVPEWASGYVNACAASGIVTGVGGGRFGTGNVTATQAALMMLKALGYFQYNSDFNGDWARATANQAARIRLFDGIDVRDNTQLTRNQVAQLALNALEATMVDAEDNTLSINTGESAGNISITGGQVNYIVRVSRDEKVAAAISDTEYSGNSSVTGLNGYTIELGEQLYGGSLKKHNDEHDDMGRPATRWEYENKDVGTYANKSDLKFSFTAKAAKEDMYAKIGSSIADDLRKNNGSGDYGFHVYVDGREMDGTNGTKTPLGANYFEKRNTNAAGTENAIGKGKNVGVSGNGVLTEVFVTEKRTNNNGITSVIDREVTIVMTNTYLVQATADYNSAKASLTVEPIDIDTGSDANNPPLDTTINNEDFDVSNVKEDDYLLVTWSYDEDCYTSVKPAEVLTANVTEYTVTDYVVMGGNKYSYNKLVGTTEKSEEFSINQDAVVVLDNYGYILAVDEAINTSSFVFIQKVAGETNLSKKAVAYGYFTDGTEGELKLSKVVDNKNSSGVALGTNSSGKLIRQEHTDGGYLSTDTYVHGWYTYVKGSDDRYTLTAAELAANHSIDSVKNEAISTPGQVNQIVFNSKVKFLNQTATGSYSNDSQIKAKNVSGNANTIFMVLDDDDELTVSTGLTTAPDVFLGKNDGATTVAANKAEISWVTRNNYARYVFIDVSDPAAHGNVDSAVNTADYLFILKDTENRTVVDGSTYYQFKVVIDGEETTRYIEESNVANVGELRYNVKSNSNDYITKATLFTDGSKAKHEQFSLGGTQVKKSAGVMDIVLGGRDYVLNDKSELNLVVHKTAADLLTKKGKDYDLYQKTSVGTIISVLDDKYVTGEAYVVVDDAGSDVVDKMWIWVDGAVDDPTELSGKSLESVTVGGVKYTDFATNETDAKNNTFDVTRDSLIGVVTAVADKGTVKKIELSQNGGAYAEYDRTASTTWSNVAGQVDVFKITVSPKDGGADADFYIAFKAVAKADDPTVPGTEIGGGSVGSAGKTELPDGADNSNDGNVKNLDDGAYVFDSDVAKDTIQTDIRGDIDQNMFFKWTNTASGTATLKIMDSNGKTVYQETSGSLGAGGHYFYVQIISDNGVVANEGYGSLRTKALTAGTYTWTIEGDYVMNSPVGDEFTVQ